jgi:hypothetical protein
MAPRIATRNWTCPFCSRPQTITDGQSTVRNVYLNLKEHKYGIVGVQLMAEACANPACQEVSLRAYFATGDDSWEDYRAKNIIDSYTLRPRTSEKPQPDFIPAAIRSDYSEACQIRDLSPKASATMARRCLQGMIRNFCGISKPTLFKEIEALREALDAGTAAAGVTHESIDAIDAVRNVGNIGAHMEKDVDLIVPIDTGEAQMLIELIEMLFDEWYVEREKRAKRLADIKALSAQKADDLEKAKEAKAKSDEANPK